MDKAIIRVADKGNIYAMLAVAYMYQYGIDTDIDYKLAIDYYRRSASLGCARAKWELAKIYGNGEIMEPDQMEFLHWLTAAADAEVPEAMFELTLRYYSGNLVREDRAMAAVWLMKVAILEYPVAEFYLAHAYYFGIQFPQDISLAQRYFTRAFQHGDAELFLDFGRKLEYGLDGIEKDLKLAATWYKHAADMGSEVGYYCYISVRNAIDNGKTESLKIREDMISLLPSIVEAEERRRNLEEADRCMNRGDMEGALDLYERSADMGDPDALFMLAIMYHTGDYVKRNDPLSYEYLERAACNGSAEAQMELASIYESGRGRPKDINRAVELYADAVARGYLVAYYGLSKHLTHPEKYVRENRRIVR